MLLTEELSFERSNCVGFHPHTQAELRTTALYNIINDIRYNEQITMIVILLRTMRQRSEEATVVIVTLFSFQANTFMRSRSNKFSVKYCIIFESPLSVIGDPLSGKRLRI